MDTYRKRSSMRKWGEPEFRSPQKATRRKLTYLVSGAMPQPKGRVCFTATVLSLRTAVMAFGR